MDEGLRLRGSVKAEKCEHEDGNDSSFDTTPMKVATPSWVRALPSASEKHLAGGQGVGDGLWHIHGRRYNMESFVDNHPGGSQAILLGKGRDCTGLFESYHLFSGDRHEKVLAKYHVDDNGLKPCNFSFKSDGLFRQCQEAAREYFRSNGLERTPTCLGWLSTAGIFPVFLFFYMLWLRGWWPAVVLMPLSYSYGGSHLLHCGTHFAMSKKPWVNRLCGYIGSAHASPLLWNHEHVIGHHQYPNVKGLDPDLYHFQMENAFRYHPAEEHILPFFLWRLSLLGLQFVCTFGLGSTVDMTAMVKGNLYNTQRFVHVGLWRWMCHVMGRLIVWSLSVAPPLLLWRLRYSGMRSLFKALLFVIIPWLVHGVSFFYISQISHINKECFDDDGVKGAKGNREENGEATDEADWEVDWAVHQIHSTWDYSTTSHLSNWLAASLNNQIVHHLFPTIHPCHYPELSPIIAKVAAKHGVDVAVRSSDSWITVVGRFYKWLAQINDYSVCW